MDNDCDGVVTKIVSVLRNLTMVNSVNDLIEEHDINQAIQRVKKSMQKMFHKDDNGTCKTNACATCDCFLDHRG